MIFSENRFALFRIMLYAASSARRHLGNGSASPDHSAMRIPGFPETRHASRRAVIVS
jgi:hypothetical protein